MKKIRLEITDANLECINSIEGSLTKKINYLISYLRIKDALEGDQNELHQYIQKSIHEGKEWGLQ